MTRFYPLLALLTLVAFSVGCDHDFAVTTSGASDNDALGLEQPLGGANAQTSTVSISPDTGPLIRWGTGQQVQFAIDRNKKQATISILGEDGETPQPVRTGKVFVLLNAPQKEIEFSALPLEDERLALPPDGERDGGSSRFIATDEVFASGGKFDGTISGMVDGTPYTGYFKDQPYR